MAPRSDIRHLIRDLGPLHQMMLNSEARKLLDLLGARATPTAMLVGIAAKDSGRKTVVWDGQQSVDNPTVALFDGVWPRIEDNVARHELNVARHELQAIEHKEEWAKRSQDERIMRSAVVQATYQVLIDYDDEHDVRSYCGDPAVVDDDLVVPVIRIPGTQHRNFPELQRFEDTARAHLNGSLGLVDVALRLLLGHATEMIESQSSHLGRQSDELAREAAREFTRTFYLAAGTAHRFDDLFMRLNSISALMYEGGRSTGQLIVARPDNPAVIYALRLKEPIPVKDHRWSRKALQMAGDGFALIADPEFIHGLGHLRAGYDFSRQDAFAVDFEGQLTWQLRHATQVLLRSELGEPRLPRESITQERFSENYSRIFPRAVPASIDLMWRLLQDAVEFGHGSQIVVAEDAADEAERLATQGTGIEPVAMTVDRLKGASRIDGGVLLDPDGVCHAIGMIFDGEATANCTASRGARYNSGVRYVQNKEKKRRLAIIVSDDRTVDIVPLLIPKALRDDIEKKTQTLETATFDSLFQVRSWLFEHESYLTVAQCTRANAALKRAELSHLGRRDTRDLKPHIGMSEEYFD